MAARWVAADQLRFVRYDSHGRLGAASLMPGILDKEAAGGQGGYDLWR